MTVILVLFTFTIFLIADYLMNRGKAPVAAAEPKPLPIPEPAPGLLEGLPAPAHLRYHPGHTWIERERKNVFRAGLDAFASAIAGNVEKIEMPKPGTWIRQGQKAITLHRDGKTFELVSPVEGEITAVNAEAIAHPEKVKADPYGEGWLFRVFAPDEEGPARNLLPANLLRGWMRESLDRLFALQPALAGATSADGGVPVADLAAALDPVPAERINEEFFLVASGK